MPQTDEPIETKADVNMPYASGASLHPAEPLCGLSTQEVEQLVSEGKVNINTELKTKSVRELIVENTCTLFNLINVVFAVLILLTGSFKNLSFLVVVVLNTGIGIVQAWRSKRLVDKLTLLTSKRATVLRDGVECEVDLDQIVLGDLIRLGRGDQIPADAEVVAGDAQVNESLLTGESNLIRKQPGSSLMSGSFIDSGLVHARVVHVGADNYVARINNEAKYVKKVNSEIMGALNAIVRFASVIMIPLGLALFCSSVHESYVTRAPHDMELVAWLLSGPDVWEEISRAILSTVGALLGMVPQGLVLLTSSVLAIATIRLARRKVLAQQLYCIETLARVDVLCLDKTGTITSGRMEVAGVYTLDEQGCAHRVGSGGAGAGEVDFALANIAHATASDANETCKALLDYYGETDIALARPLSVVPFSSAKKWSGATFPSGSYLMGAAQFALDAQDFSRIQDAVNDLADTCRVLVVAAVEGFTDEGEMIGRARPVGLVAIRDEIRPAAADTISYFCEQGVTLNVISGDDPRTVSSIARVVGIPGADAYVDATTLNTPAKLDAAVDRFHVFGRVTPQQKRDLVVALKRRGHTVAMTGDGVNDVLALKEADCSVAMAAGSDAARNVAEIVLVDNDFSSMPAVVAEGRRSINNLQRSATLFLTKTLFSMGLAALCIFVPPYPFQPVTMSLISFFCIGFPSFVLALESNRARVRGHFLVNVLKRACPAGIAVVLACMLCMMASGAFGLQTLDLSTMCLISTSVVGISLIWRISWPFTVLHAVLLVAVIAGMCAGIFLFPDFFAISFLTLPNALITAVISAVSVAAFFLMARSIDEHEPVTRRLATGFGRGVRVSHRAGTRHVASTGSALRRFVQSCCSSISRWRAKEQARRERVRARLSAEQDGSGDVTASEGQTPSKLSGRPRRVVKSAEGIRVAMPKAKGSSRKKDGAR